VLLVFLWWIRRQQLKKNPEASGNCGTPSVSFELSNGLSLNLIFSDVNCDREFYNSSSNNNIAFCPKQVEVG
jgi:hypothetical protein